MLLSYRLGCAWLADVLWLFMALDECTSVFSMVLLVLVGVAMLLASFAGV